MHYVIIPLVSMVMSLYLIYLEKTKLQSLRSSVQLIYFINAMQLSLIFPLPFKDIGLIALGISCCFTLLAGKFHRASAISLDFFNGGMSAVMGAMVGITAVNPTLCGLPMSISSISHTRIAFSLMGLLLLGVTILIIQFSFRRNHTIVGK